MVAIIPTLFALDQESFLSKLKALSFAKQIHLDFMDATLTSQRSVSFAVFRAIELYPQCTFAVHLMTRTPLQYLDEIKNLPIFKVLIQLESFASFEACLDAISQFKDSGLSVFLVVNPDKSLSDFENLLAFVDGLMCMSVWPGAEGQSFIFSVLNVVKAVKTRYPRLLVQLDGGLNIETIPSAVQAGASVLCVGSAISSKTDPRKAYLELEKLVS